ncbi:hypothetical protein GPECTOR_81g205 [Gonium pectorale]|uniref:AAA+ ATPase domain-containing protein n=1 Tax=Gonium pectorale TaxID=33097 RepID=A0A150G2L7_GONPE|nr:hypothetical protein GPECTOR_81g205 [Gonium pectorale]|eukprot:KXZ43755.1 hypothetical protein GPECTOR_81g205 [Gonium pectorale]
MPAAATADGRWSYLPTDLYSLDPDDAFQRLLEGPPPAPAAEEEEAMRLGQAAAGGQPPPPVPPPGGAAGLTAFGAPASGVGDPEAAGVAAAGDGGSAADWEQQEEAAAEGANAVFDEDEDEEDDLSDLAESGGPSEPDDAADMAAGGAAGASEAMQVDRSAAEPLAAEADGGAFAAAPGADALREGEIIAVKVEESESQDPDPEASFEEDPQLEEFLGMLPPGLHDEIRRRVAASSGGGDGAAGGSGSTLPLTPPRRRYLVDVCVDSGRDVRLAFSDGSKEVLAGRRVPIAEALRHLDDYVLRLRQRQQGAEGDSEGAAAAMEAEGLEMEDWGASGVKRARTGGNGDSAGSDGDGDRDVAGRGSGRAPASTALFGSDNRCCPPGTLHRISRLVHPYDGSVYGLTYRVGRHLPGLAGAVQDVLTDLAGRARAAREVGYEAGASRRELAGSLLLLGRPGSGKTTLLRDIARFLADDLGLGVVVVDTSNEIAGGDVLPHGCIGGARRILVGERGSLARVMLEAVQNHGPEVVLVDEIANKQEVDAARTISSRGVMLVATCHGTELGSLVRNAELNALVGGLQPVILGDEAAGRTNGGTKTRTERRGAPTFRTLVEVLGGGRLRLRPDVATSVDVLLGNEPPEGRAIKALLNPSPLLRAPPGAEEEVGEG